MLKRNVLVLAAVFILVIFVSAAGAYDYSKIIPEKSGVMIKLNIKPFLNSYLLNPFIEGASKKVQDEILAEFEKRTGLSFKRDINEIGIFIRPAIDIKAGMPNNIILFLTGSFNIEKIMAELEKEKNLPFKIVTEKGRKVFAIPGIKGTFIDKETLVVCTEDVMSEIIEGKYKTATLSDDIKLGFEKSNIFVHISAGADENSAFRKIVNDFVRNPNIHADAGAIIEKIDTFTFYDQFPLIFVKADLLDKNFCGQIEGTITTLKAMAKTFLDSEEKKALEKMKTASTFEMIGPEISGARTIIALGNELLDAAEFSSKDKSIMLKFSVPPVYNNMLTPSFIPVAGIILAVALPQFAAMTDGAKYTKAKQDCDTFVQAIQKFNSLENTTVQDRFMIELKGKYITNLDTVKDPWGNRYEQDYKKGMTYSKGPDGKHDPALKQNDGVNKDDIFSPYMGPACIVDAVLEANPAGGNITDPADAEKCYDVLHLYFSKEVSWTGLDFSKISATAKDNNSRTDDGASPGTPCANIFRFYDSNSETATPLAVVGAGIDDLKNIADKSTVTYGTDSREVVIRFPAGFTCKNPAKKLPVPGKHYINAVGSEETRNPCFYETNGILANEGAVSYAPVLIRKNE